MALKGKTATKMETGTAEQATADAAAAAAAQAGKLTDHSEEALPWDDQVPASAAPAAPAAPAASVPATVPGNAVARTGMGNVPVLQNDGFNDLDGEIGFGSFPIIKLDKDKFVVEDEEVEEFTCVMLQSRDKWIFKADDDNLFYSTDGLHDSAGRTVESRLAEWKATGFEPSKIDKRKYKEVVVKMLDTNLAGSLALLSIPPASVKRLGGYRAEIGVSKGLTLQQVATKCLKGAKVQVSPKISFYPWNFKFERVLEAGE